MSTYGWRAYALPALVGLTLVVVYQTVTGTSTPNRRGDHPGAADYRRGGHSIIDTPPRGLVEFDANLPAGTLPNGGHSPKPATKLIA